MNWEGSGHGLIGVSSTNILPRQLRRVMKVGIINGQTEIRKGNPRYKSLGVSDTLFSSVTCTSSPKLLNALGLNLKLREYRTSYQSNLILARISSILYEGLHGSP
jgi:hypothetical protein